MLKLEAGGLVDRLLALGGLLPLRPRAGEFVAKGCEISFQRLAGPQRVVRSEALLPDLPRQGRLLRDRRGLGQLQGLCELPYLVFELAPLLLDLVLC